MPWSFPQPRIHTGRYVTLQPLQPEQDVEALYRVSHGSPEAERVWDYLASGPFPDPNSMLVFLKRIVSHEDSLAFSVKSNMLGYLVGHIVIMSTVPEHGRSELGNIWYAPVVQRSRVNTECNYLLLRYMFDELGYRRMEWKCNNKNERSKAAALRLGYRYEGLFRQHLIVKGQNRDTAWFSMLDSEWPERKQVFEHYLANEAVSLKMPA